MRIAFSHTRYSRVGGIEGYIDGLLGMLLAEGHQVDYYCAWHEPLEHPLLRFIKVPWIKGVRSLKVLSFALATARALGRERYDLVHGFTKCYTQDVYTDGSGCLADFQAYSLGGRSGSPWAALKRWSPHQRAVAWTESRRYAPGACARVLTMSRLIKDQIQGRYHLGDDVVEVLYNGVDVDRFHPRNRATLGLPLRASLGLAPNRPVILFVGNDYRRKGLDVLLEALARPAAAAFQLLVAGRERHEARFRARASVLGLESRVNWLGARRDAEALFGAADVFCLPTRFDAYGNVVPEAMAAGVPPIVSAQAGAHEIVDHGVSGWVLRRADDVGALAELLGQAADATRRTELGAHARVRAEGLCWEHHFARLREVYAEVSRSA